MSDGPADTPTPQASAGTPVTVVGYPDLATVTSTPPLAGLASVRMTVSTVRALAAATLVLVVLLTAGLLVGILTLRGQVADLSRQVSDLASQQQAPATASTDQPGSAPLASQLPPAPELPADIPAPEGVDATGAVLIGSEGASNVVEVYVDYQCPFCQRWEKEIGEVLAQRAQDPASDLLVKQYNLAFLGEVSPTLDPPGASARAASAALCVVEGEGPGTFAAFNASVFSVADSQQETEQFTTADMAALAEQVGASPGTLACIEEQRHVPFVALLTQAGFGRGVQGTPTVLVNGRLVEDSFSDPELIGLLG